jgi:hypothetical protein
LLLSTQGASDWNKYLQRRKIWFFEHTNRILYAWLHINPRREWSVRFRFFRLREITQYNLLEVIEIVVMSCLLTQNNDNKITRAQEKWSENTSIVPLMAVALESHGSFYQNEISTVKSGTNEPFLLFIIFFLEKIDKHTIKYVHVSQKHPVNYSPNTKK